MKKNKNKKKYVILTLREDYIAKRKERRDAVDQKIISWILKLNLIPILISNKSDLKFIKLINPVGLILSGGNDINPKSNRFKTEKKLINWAKKNKKPLLGICHGLQMIAYLNGSKMKKVKGHVNTKHKLISISKEIKFPRKVNSFHNLTLANCPKNFFVTAYSPEYFIEAIKHSFLKWEGWMWHPERDKKFNKLLIKRARKLFTE